MGLKSRIIAPFAAATSRRVEWMSSSAQVDQEKIFNHLLHNGKKTAFGKEHGFDSISTHSDYTSKVPIRDYEGLRPFVDRILRGEGDVLWPGKPKYFAKTSGTTSGIKYIPITHESMPYHISTMRMAVLSYAYRNDLLKIFDNKWMFLSGSPEMKRVSGINTGRLSGIVNHEIPFWLRGQQVPSDGVNRIEDWEKKVEAVVKETSAMKMSVIGGIPPWVQMYYEQLLEYTGQKSVSEVFPSFQFFVYGGVNYEPYRNVLNHLVGRKIHSLETYPASEGFIAFQDQAEGRDLLLNTDGGIFYEFVLLSEIHDGKPVRLTLADVKTNMDYVVIINSNAGLWAYNLGDTVRFTSLDPYRLIVSGRVKHFISAFGEHVIGKEVEEAMSKASQQLNFDVVEFTVAPNITPTGGMLPHHEWYIEFGDSSIDHVTLQKMLDYEVQAQNIYYRDLIEGKVLQPLSIISIEKGGFRKYMESIGKLGGQNKVPRLSNDRKIAEKMKNYLSKNPV